jgi:hypothetical protein
VLNVRSINPFNAAQTLNGLTAPTPDQVVLVTPTTAGNVTLTLPAAATSTGQVIHIKNLSTTLDFTLAGVSGGNVNVDFSPAGFPDSGSVVTVVSNGTTWFIINGH